MKRLENEVTRQKRKAMESESGAKLLDSRLVEAEKATRELCERKRQDTRADSRRRIEVDPTCADRFTDANKSTAMQADRTGLVDVLRYWCKGSEVRAVELIMSQIKHFDLGHKVAAELGAQCETTNSYIVGRANAALQELKQCKSEQQRQEYRIVLTALAPEHGMVGPVAAALGVGRQKKPFLDGMKKRDVIDRMINKWK